jgi:hypothetical protein
LFFLEFGESHQKTNLPGTAHPHSQTDPDHANPTIQKAANQRGPTRQILKGFSRSELILRVLKKPIVCQLQSIIQIGFKFQPSSERRKGTTPMSDFSRAFVSGDYGRRPPSTTPTVTYTSEFHEISRFPSVEFPCMHRVFDSTWAVNDSLNNSVPDVAFPIKSKG